MVEIKEKKLQLLQSSLKSLERIEDYISSILNKNIPQEKDIKESTSSKKYNDQIASLNTYKEFTEAVSCITKKAKEDILREISVVESQSDDSYQQDNNIIESIDKFWKCPAEIIKGKTNEFRESQNDNYVRDLYKIIDEVEKMDNTVQEIMATASNLEESASVFERVNRPTAFQRFLQYIRSYICCCECCDQMHRTDYEVI